MTIFPLGGKDGKKGLNVEYPATPRQALSDKERDDDLNALELTPELQTNAVTDQQYPRKLFATLVLGGKPVKIQIDSGATCNIITQGLLDECLGKCELQTTTRVLTMYNRSTETPTGRCTIKVTNLKNKSYETDFVVIANNNCPPLLGRPSSQQMELIQAKHENI